MLLKLKRSLALAFVLLTFTAFLLNPSRGGSEERLETLPERLGGEGSVTMRGADAYSLPMRNATTAHRRSFIVGNSLFKENWVASPASVMTRQGLGPMFNAQSCSSCHFKDGRGQPPAKVDEAFSSMLVRISVPGFGANGGPNPVPHYGDQIQHRAIVGVKPEGDVRVSYTNREVSYPDGSSVTLRVPTYRFENLIFGEMPEGTMISPRVAPAVIGLGLLEAVSEKEILAYADPDDRDGDKISGRANQVWDVGQKRKRLGRFGWKANQPSLSQQNAGAFHGDMGITSKHFSEQNCPPDANDCKKAPSLKDVEIDDRARSHMDTYIRLLAVPTRRGADDPEVRAGYLAFREAQCQSCHRESHVSSVVEGFPELSNQKIYPFTDLLLHDMGEELADNRPDFEANGREWRTPPLWGLGLQHEVNGHTNFLHDGRARGFEEAILWHGGEAGVSRSKFMAMKSEKRKAMIKFLESL
jgi:CxxC motif-containing protein (DUF1111 family)